MVDEHSAEIRFWFRVAGAVFVAAAVVAFFTGFFNKQFHGATGEAQWIWPETELSAGEPLAFFAVKEFEIPADPPFVRIKIACDPEYALYFNGQTVGRALAGDASILDVYDVTTLAKPGTTNRIVIAARSPNGVGGLIAAVDYAPMRENDVVTDATWSLLGEWHDELPQRAIDVLALPVRVLGAPPYGRWNELSVVRRELVAESSRRIAPVESRPASIPVPRIRVVSGVAVASTEKEPATAWGFGEFEGRCLLRDSSAGVSSTRLVRFRYGSGLDDFGREGEIRRVALAPGETVYLDPREAHARWVAVFEPGATPAIVPSRDSVENETPGD